MAAVGENTRLRLGGPALDAANLLDGSVFVLFALDGEYRAADAVNVGFNVPGPEFRVQTYVVPSPERRLGVLVVAPQLGRQIGVQVGLADRKSTRLNSRHSCASRMPSSA